MYATKQANVLSIDSRMGIDVDCYGTKECCGDCDSCSLFGQLAVVTVNRYFACSAKKTGKEQHGTEE